MLYDEAPVWFFNYNKAVMAYQPWVHGLQANADRAHAPVSARTSGSTRARPPSDATVRSARHAGRSEPSRMLLFSSAASPTSFPTVLAVVAADLRAVQRHARQLRSSSMTTTAARPSTRGDGAHAQGDGARRSAARALRQVRRASSPRGDLGTSFRTREPVTKLLGRARSGRRCSWSSPRWPSRS